MAIQDRILTLAEDGDPAGLTASTLAAPNLKVIGSAVNLDVDVYNMFGSTSEVFYSPPTVKPLYMNFHLSAGVSDRTTNQYVIALLTDGGAPGGNVSSNARIMAMSTFDASRMVAGYTGSVAIAPGANLFQYIQAAVGSRTAVADEAGRFNVWLSVDPTYWRVFPEGRN